MIRVVLFDIQKTVNKSQASIQQSNMFDKCIIVVSVNGRVE